jgi:protease PrsW
MLWVRLFLMIDFGVFIILAALPAVVLLVYFYRQDKARPEPLGLIWKGVLFGFVAVIPAIIAELCLAMISPPGILGIIFKAFVIAALVEESIKYFFIKSFLFRNAKFDECIDGILYAVCVSLGFAFVENVVYGLRDRNALIIRAFTAVPMHAVATGIMGYYLGRAKVTKTEGPDLLAAKGLKYAVLVHGFYDLFLFIGGLVSLVSLAILGGGWVVLRRLIKDAKEIDIAMRGNKPLDPVDGQGA